MHDALVLFNRVFKSVCHIVTSLGLVSCMKFAYLRLGLRPRVALSLHNMYVVLRRLEVPTD